MRDPPSSLDLPHVLRIFSLCCAAQLPYRASSRSRATEGRLNARGEGLQICPWRATELAAEAVNCIGRACRRSNQHRRAAAGAPRLVGSFLALTPCSAHLPRFLTVHFHQPLLIAPLAPPSGLPRASDHTAYLDALRAPKPCGRRETTVASERKDRGTSVVYINSYPLDRAHVAKGMRNCFKVREQQKVHTAKTLGAGSAVRSLSPVAFR